MKNQPLNAPSNDFTFRVEGDDYFCADSFGSVDEALEAARDHYRETIEVSGDTVKGNEVFKVEIARFREPEASEFVPDAHSIVEDMQESAYEQVDESADEWLSDIFRHPAGASGQEEMQAWINRRDEVLKDLDDRIADAINDWAEKHGHKPTFGVPDLIETHTVSLETS